MSSDIELDSDGDILVDHTHDLSLVSDRDWVEQKLYMLSYNAIVDFLGDSLSRENVAQMQFEIGDALRDFEAIDEIVQVSIVDFDRTDGTVDIEIDVVPQGQYHLDNVGGSV